MNTITLNTVALRAATIEAQEFLHKDLTRATVPYIHPRDLYALVNRIVWQYESALAKEKQKQEDAEKKAAEEKQRLREEIVSVVQEQLAPLAKFLERYPQSVEDADLQYFRDRLERVKLTGDEQAIFKAQKQLELLEDATIIYRIGRAPTRKVIDVDLSSCKSIGEQTRTLHIINDIFRQQRGE
jgi:hypothetical protein